MSTLLNKTKNILNMPQTVATNYAKLQAEKGNDGNGTPKTQTEPTTSSAGSSELSAYQNHINNPVASWTGGTYGQALNEAMNKITNREPFSYDLNGDALYQQYKDKYINQGRLAMADTIGQASALTGGYGNSYAATAGNQAYQGYLQNLNDVVPELYQLAYDKYNNEGQDLMNQYSMYNNAYNTEYSQYRDQVSDWNNTADRLYNEYSDAQNLALQRAKLAQDQSQFDAEMKYKYTNALLGSSGGSGGSSSSKNTTDKTETPKYTNGMSAEDVTDMIALYLNGDGKKDVAHNPSDSYLNDRSIDMWLNDHGISGDASDFFKAVLRQEYNFTDRTNGSVGRR